MEACVMDDMGAGMAMEEECTGWESPHRVAKDTGHGVRNEPLALPTGQGPFSMA